MPDECAYFYGIYWTRWDYLKPTDLMMRYQPIIQTIKSEYIWAPVTGDRQTQSLVLQYREAHLLAEKFNVYHEATARKIFVDLVLAY